MKNGGIAEKYESPKFRPRIMPFILSLRPDEGHDTHNLEYCEDHGLFICSAIAPLEGGVDTSIAVRSHGNTTARLHNQLTVQCQTWHLALHHSPTLHKPYVKYILQKSFSNLTTVSVS